MTGKKNIVFGFLNLVLRAALKPCMVKEVYPDIATAIGFQGQPVDS